MTNSEPENCERCGAELTDDEGASWPYCPRCGWTPDELGLPPAEDDMTAAGDATRSAEELRAYLEDGPPM